MKQNSLELQGRLNLGDATELTIASGVITITKASTLYTVDGEGDAADSLLTINGGVEGDEILLLPENASRNITIATGTGNILVPSGVDYIIPDTGAVKLYYDGSNWIVLGVTSDITSSSTSTLTNKTLTQLLLTSATELTIASGIITVTQGFHSVDGEGDTSDDLVTINGNASSNLLVIYPNNSARNITLKHGTGNIVTHDASDYTIPDNASVILVYDGSNWRVVGITAATATVDIGEIYALN